MKILVTGAAGFIGFHLTKRLVKENHNVIGLDDLNDNYSTDLKYDRLANIGIIKDSIIGDGLIESVTNDNLRFIKKDLENKEIINQLFNANEPDIVIKLEAQAGSGQIFNR